MAYQTMRDCLKDLDKTGQLIIIEDPVDPNLVIAEIHRRVFEAGGPALLFASVKGSPFPAVSNIYGTFERTEFMFRDTLPKVKEIVRMKADPSKVLKSPFSSMHSGLTAITALPKKVRSPLRGFKETSVSALPQIISWPDDGGAFVTMPQVLTLPPGEKSIMKSNMGMYRVQLSGNQYVPDEEIGMHYQLHRGIGVHHTAYNKSSLPFNASVFIGGSPSHAFAAIMPLPEGLSELTFAGMLAGRRFRYGMINGHVISCDADFVITGVILKDVSKPEGPFGDHLGYYSLRHDFAVMKVHKVYHRKNAVWHFSVVGRPPMEDSSFGHLIHEIVSPLLTQEFPGIREVNAVDAAGVHPLLLAVGSERYMPFREKRPEEILTMANHLLGKGQTSLAKYLIIADGGDHPDLNAHNIAEYLDFVLRRIVLTRDLHFYTNTTIDTLDYSGSGWNAGSKLVLAASGPTVRGLAKELPSGLNLPTGFREPRMIIPGVMAISGPVFDAARRSAELEGLANKLHASCNDIPLVVVCDESAFLTEHINNFLWVTFTRSDPAADIFGANARFVQKHWSCDVPVVIDARIKPHHAPVMTEDPNAIKEADEIISRNAALRALGI